MVSILPTLPEGDVMQDYLRKKTKLENKLDDLGFKREDAGATKLLVKLLELGQIEAGIAETDAFIAAVTAHKATLN